MSTDPTPQTGPGYQLFLGDCLEVLRSMPDNSVDQMIADLPYGTTELEWDKPIDLLSFWEQVRRVSKAKANWVCFAQQPFTTDLINSNRKEFRYSLVWPKTTTTGFLNASRRPLVSHEDVLLFGNGQGAYNPQKWDSGVAYKVTRKALSPHYGSQTPLTQKESTGERYPTSVLPLCAGAQAYAEHPTQKPLELLEYLLLTYSNPGDVVGDFTFGSGTTGVAAAKHGRWFVGAETSPKYFADAHKRIAAAYAQQPLLVL